MMVLRWNRGSGTLSIDGIPETFVAVSDVRNEINGRRKLHEKKEVVRAVVNGQWGPPYMPRSFPFGTWDVMSVEPISSERSEFYPIKIKTNAKQRVRAWVLDAMGGYDHPSDEYVEDSGYHLHWTPSKTTLGCIRVGRGDPEQIRALGGYVAAALDKNEKVILIAGA